jgi:hypothetical protein
MNGGIEGAGGGMGRNLGAGADEIRATCTVEGHRRRGLLERGFDVGVVKGGVQTQAVVRGGAALEGEEGAEATGAPWGEAGQWCSMGTSRLRPTGDDEVKQSRWSLV